MLEGNTYIEDPVDAAQSLLGGFAEAEGIAIQSNNDWLELNLDASVLFAPGQSQLSSSGREMLSTTLDVLQRSDNPITIEGYTDNVPSTSRSYPSNWELSSARASAVARFYVERGIRAERIAAVGYGENHPLATNATPEGRAANRRVVVVVARRRDASRNLNADPDAAAFAVVRGQARQEIDPDVIQSRTEDGGLLFSNNPLAFPEDIPEESLEE